MQKNPIYNFVVIAEFVGWAKAQSAVPTIHLCSWTK
jgi:hypothetical protein